MNVFYNIFEQNTLIFHSRFHQKELKKENSLGK